MGIYIKLFNDHSQYEEYINGEGAILPNVSYCINQYEVHYNPHCDPSDEYTVSDVTASEVEASATSNTITWSWERISTDEKCAETITTGESSSSVTFEPNTTPEDRTVSGTIEWNGVEIEYSFVQEGVYAVVAKYIPVGIQRIDIAHSLTADTKEMWVDGVKQDNVTATYTFPTDGEHEVLFVLKDGVTSVRNGAFRFCDRLVDAVIPSGITIVGQEAFYNCGNLSSITIPNDVTSIGHYAFYGCSSLTRLNSNIDGVFNIPSTTTSIGSSVFYGCSGLTSIDIPSGVTSIGSYMFFNCGNLTSVTTSSGVTSIGAGAFSNCSGLTRLNSDVDGVFIIPSSVTIIDETTFQNCSGLTSIDIPSGVTYIGASAFTSASSLVNITIPGRVTGIGGSAFKGCLSLSNVTCLPTTPPMLDFAVFNDNASGRKIYVPSGSVTAYKSATNWNAYASDILPIT